MSPAARVGPCDLTFPGGVGVLCSTQQLAQETRGWIMTTGRYWHLMLH